MLRQGSVSGPENPAPWYTDGLRFACLQCGRCCSGAPGYVWITARELVRIARYCGLTAREFARRHVRTVGRRRSLLEKPGGDCEFLERPSDGTTRCGIHPVRPVQCRTWPFWKSNVDTPGQWQLMGRHCPGIDNGGYQPLGVIADALQANDGLPL